MSGECTSPADARALDFAVRRAGSMIGGRRCPYVRSLGVPELIFILVLALLIFGPKRLPEIGRTRRPGLAEFRKASNELKRTINTELALDEQPAAAGPAAGRRPVRGSTRCGRPGGSPGRRAGRPLDERRRPSRSRVAETALRRRRRPVEPRAADPPPRPMIARRPRHGPPSHRGGAGPRCRSWSTWRSCASASSGRSSALAVAFVPCWIFVRRDLRLPASARSSKLLPPGKKLAFTGVTDPFILYFKVAALAALFLAAPFILYQLWRFVAPGLYRHEQLLRRRRSCSSARSSSSAGGAFAYYVAFPLAAEFLLKHGRATSSR